MSKAKLDRQGNYIYIGVYDCEMDVVGLLGEVGTANGHVFFPWAQEKDAPKARHSKVRGMCYVTVGLDQRYWSECIEILLHEILEYEFVRMNVRYNNSSNLYDRSEERRVGKECRSRW